MALVTRNHPKLTLEGARAVLAAAERRAEEIRVPMDVAVVDDGGHLLVFERMDGARPSSIAISMVKAQAAALRRGPTGPAMAGDQVNLPLALGLAIASPSGVDAHSWRSAAGRRWPSGRRGRRKRGNGRSRRRRGARGRCRD